MKKALALKVATKKPNPSFVSNEPMDAKERKRIRMQLSALKAGTPVSNTGQRLIARKVTTPLEDAMQVLVDFFNRDQDLTLAEKANMADTAKRVAKMWMETTITRTQIEKELRIILGTSFPSDNANTERAMVTLGPVKVHSWCPHHLLPVTYECYASYLPKKKGRLIGLSKIARLAEILGKRPVLHEELAKDIAEVLHSSKRWPAIQSQGSAVMLIGRHSCMSCRGVKSDALTSATEISGVFFKPEMKQEFYAAVAHMRESKL